MKLNLNAQILDWNGRPTIKPASNGEQQAPLTLFNLIIPGLYTADLQGASKEKKAEMVAIADKIKGSQTAGEVALTVDELKLIQDAIEPSLLPFASVQFCKLINGEAAGQEAKQLTRK